MRKRPAPRHLPPRGRDEVAGPLSHSIHGRQRRILVQSSFEDGSVSAFYIPQRAMTFQQKRPHGEEITTAETDTEEARRAQVLARALAQIQADRVARIHGGTVRAENRVGGGLEVVMTIQARSDDMGAG
jgi:hypothetical protein